MNWNFDLNEMPKNEPLIIYSPYEDSFPYDIVIMSFNLRIEKWKAVIYEPIASGRDTVLVLPLERIKAWAKLTPPTESV